jgi:hypothetical protein
VTRKRAVQPATNPPLARARASHLQPPTSATGCASVLLPEGKRSEITRANNRPKRGAHPPAIAFVTRSASEAASNSLGRTAPEGAVMHVSSGENASSTPKCRFGCADRPTRHLSAGNPPSDSQPSSKAIGSLPEGRSPTTSCLWSPWHHRHEPDGEPWPPAESPQLVRQRRIRQTDSPAGCCRRLPEVRCLSTKSARRSFMCRFASPTPSAPRVSHPLSGLIPPTPRGYVSSHFRP